MQPVIFYLFAGVSVLSALSVVLNLSPTRALLSLIVTLFSLAVLFLLLEAPFIAMVHIIVYAGAVLVLFLFVIMLQGVGAQETPLRKRFPLDYIFLAIVVSGAFLGALIIIFMKLSPADTYGAEGSIHAIAQLLFSNYLLPFELISFLLLLGIFTAVGLAKPEKHS